MSDKRDEKHQKARDIAEEALDEMVEGHDETADALLEASKKLNPTAARELAEELNEEAGDNEDAGDPNAAKQSGGDQTGAKARRKQ